MAPLIFSLCHKPVIGLVMFVLFLCGAPRLFSDEPIDLTVAGSTVTRSVTVPIDITYALEVTFEFPSTEARLNDHVVGDRYSKDCLGVLKYKEIPEINYEEIPEIKRIGLGRPIPFSVVVRQAKDRSVVVEETFESLCATGWSENSKYREIAWLHLSIGDYIAEVTNLQAQSDLPGVHTTISLHGIQRK